MGFALFFVEMYLFPGTLIAGGIGVMLVIVALTLSLQTFTVPDPKLPWEFKSLVDNLFMTVGTAVLAIFIPLLAIRFALPHLAGPAKIISDATLAESRSVSSGTAKIAVGISGTAKTPLRPTGKAAFGTVTLEVSSRGEFIEPGQSVEVCQIQGNKIVVRIKDNPA
jgi:membrane-bound serine protease (ClpP class)